MKTQLAVIALCMAVWLQQTQSVLKYDGKLNEKVYKKNGMETVDLSCGKVPESFVAIEWARYISNQSTKILKIYNDTTEKHYDGYTSSKYSISETEPTSLLIKNIEISDTGYYICHTVGEQVGYKYTTLLHVVENATKINMTRFAQQGIEEESEAEYVCETDCAYPGPPIVLWYVADEPVNINHGHIMNNTLSCGDYNGQKTESTLQLTTKREMNKKNIKCVLENDDTKFSEHNLDIMFKPDGLDMKIGNAVKENTNISVECEANSSNPASEVGMKFFINGSKESNITPQVTRNPGWYNGIVKTFVFTFTTDRNQNGMIPRCVLLWKKDSIYNITDGTLNITYPPDVSLDGTTMPTVEYTTRNITCKVNGGNPSDPRSYTYKWMHRPIYADTYISMLHGGSHMSGGNTLQLKGFGYEDMAGIYKCTVVSIGGQNSVTGTLQVYSATSRKVVILRDTIIAVLVIIVIVVLAVVFMLRKKNKERSQGDETQRRDRVENDYQNFPGESDYNPVEATEMRVLPIVVDDTFHARPNEIPNVQVHATQASRSNGEPQADRGKKSKLKDPSITDDDPLHASPNIKHKVPPKLGMLASGSKTKSSTGTGKKPKIRDLPMVDDNPVHAKSNKKPKEQSKSGMQASGRKGKSATGRGKKSRPRHSSHTAMQPPINEEPQSVELVKMSNRPVAEDDEDYLDMNRRKNQVHQQSGDGKTLVYADLTFQHIVPAHQQALPNEADKVTYASVGFDLNLSYTEKRKKSEKENQE